ncbi:MAG: diguanylate cyclase [Anaerolineaceae bacterium]|nr:diguanylate cyclase [Anaerolineaceae bacterium]
MTISFTVYVILGLMSALLTGGLAFYTWHRRSIPAAVPFLSLMLLITFFTLVKVTDALLNNPVFASVSQRLVFISLTLIPVAWFLFVRDYTGRTTRITKKQLAALLIIPAITLVLVAADQQNVLVGNIQTGWKSWGFVHIAYSYSLIAVGVVMLVVTAGRSIHMFRNQMIVILIGAIAPWILSLLITFGMITFDQYDLLPVAFGVTGLTLAWGMFKFRIFDLSHMARDAIVDTMEDCVIVTDHQNRIIDANPAAASLFKIPAPDLIGRSALEVFSKWPEVINHVRQSKNLLDEVLIQFDGTERWYEIRISPLTRKKNQDSPSTASLIILHNITDRKMLEELDSQRLHELEVLRDTANNISGELDITLLLERIVDQLITLVKADFGRLAIYDESRQDLEMVVSLKDLAPRQGQRIPLGEGGMGQAAQQLSSVMIDSEQVWEGTAPNGESFTSRAAMLYVPLIFNQGLLGVVAVGLLNESRKFSAHDLHLTEMFAQQAAIAIQNARLFSDLQRMATTDMITGICNRRFFMERAQMEYERARRHRKPLSVILFDIDNFKKVNDEYGHAIGDQILKRVVGVCQESIRVYDILGRYGGDEFVLLLPETRLEAARHAAERLRKHMEQSEMPFEHGGIYVTVSLGVAELSDLPGRLDAFINRADQALYRAKNNGRNQVAI